MAQNSKRRLVAGWTAVAVTVVFTCLWSYWGIVENFHEGWYSKSLLENLAMLFLQYLSLTIVFSALAVCSVRWPKAGLILHIGLGLFFAWFFRSAAFSVVGVMIVLPMLGLGLIYFYGRPHPRKWAYWLIIALPLAIILGITPFKIHQVTQRVNDGDFSIRRIEGNGVSLIWAPKGVGWPDGGISYEEAVDRCRHLSQDGTQLMEDPQDIWRLPTVEETVRSMMLHNENAGGRWDSGTGKAVFDRTPDKETPLWDPNSQIIYYWAQDTIGTDQAYIIVYDGGVFARQKNRSYGYLSFRAVKDAGISPINAQRDTSDR